MESDGFVLVNRQMEQLSLNEMSSSTAYSAARRHLESIAEHYKFSVNYTDFPVVHILSINQGEGKKQLYLVHITIKEIIGVKLIGGIETKKETGNLFAVECL